MARVRDLMGTGNSAESARAIAGTAGTIAATGTTAATGKMASYETNHVTSGAGADSVVLPTGAQGSQPGDSAYVLAASATTVQVFAGGSDTINGSASAFTVAQNKMGIFKRTGATTWGAMVTA